MPCSQTTSLYLTLHVQDSHIGVSVGLCSPGGGGGGGLNTRDWLIVGGGGWRAEH